VVQVVQVVPLQKIADSRAPLGELWEDVTVQKIARRLAAINDSGHVVGQDHHRAKLTDHDIWLIHELRAEGIKRREIAIKFEISFYTVCEILAGRRRGQVATGQKRRT
jgi:hypothetical protein